MRPEPPSVGILSSFGHSTNSAGFLQRLVLIESSFARALYVVAPDKGWKDRDNVIFHRVGYEIGKNPLSQIANQAASQVSMSILLARLTKRVDYWIFYGGDVLLLPALVARLSGRRMLLALAGNLEREAQLKKNILNGFQLFMRRIVFALSTRIILYSEALIDQWQLGRYRKKIVIADNHFVDLDTFRVERPLRERDNVVGYVGRLSEEKGVFNLAEAIPLVLGDEPTVRFLIVGSGPLRDKIHRYLEQNGLMERVKMVERVPGNAVPGYLNDLKLCVLPSYTEGMPNVVLEAMACGAPVLATPVGAVPDLIEEGRTGFLMEGNSSVCIARNIIRALRHRELSTVADSARRQIEQRFTFEMATRSFRRVDLVMARGGSPVEMSSD